MSKKRRKGKKRKKRKKNRKTSASLDLWSPWTIIAQRREVKKNQEKYTKQKNDIEWHGLHCQRLGVPERYRINRELVKTDIVLDHLVPKPTRLKLQQTSCGVFKYEFRMARDQWGTHGFKTGKGYIGFIELILRLYEKFMAGFKWEGKTTVAEFYQKIKASIGNLDFELTLVESKDIPALNEYPNILLFHNLQIEVDIEEEEFVHGGGMRIRTKKDEDSEAVELDKKRLHEYMIIPNGTIPEVTAMYLSKEPVEKQSEPAAEEKKKRKRKRKGEQADDEGNVEAMEKQNEPLAHEPSKKKRRKLDPADEGNAVEKQNEPLAHEPSKKKKRRKLDEEEEGGLEVESQKKKKKKSRDGAVSSIAAETNPQVRNLDEVVGDALDFEGTLNWNASVNDGGFVDSQPPPAKKLFVGNLPHEADSNSLAELFEQAGVVDSAEVIIDRMSGESRGFGFVTMSTVEEANKAMELFNSYKMGRRWLTVRIAAPKGSRPECAPRGNTFRIFVENLPWEVDSTKLEEVFGDYGTVVSARVVSDRETGKSRGIGFVQMSSQSEMNNAIANLDGDTRCFDRQVRVKPAEERLPRF